MSDPTDAPSAGLAAAIAHAAHVLPAQGPITVFIHHNTLHAFEHLPFDQGVRDGAALFGCRPYLSEEQYRAAVAAGRILPRDIEAVLAADLGGRGAEAVAGLAGRYELRHAMLACPLREPPAHELAWFMAETDALVHFRPETPPDVRAKLTSEAGSEAAAVQALWDAARAGVQTVPVPPAVAPRRVRARDRLLAATGHDADLLVHPVLIRFCAAYLDQGFASWPLPGREGGFLAAFVALYAAPAAAPARWLRGLPAELAAVHAGRRSAPDIVRTELAAAGVADADTDDYLTAVFLALRGWGGMIEQVRTRADAVARPVAADSLTEFLAVRLVLDRYAAAAVARMPADPEPPAAPPTVDQRAFLVFQLAQVCGWSAATLAALPPAGWADLLAETTAFGGLDRRRVFHAAFERRYRVPALDALAAHAATRHPPAAAVPAFQAVFCLDEREESFRRHVEEVCPAAETFGAAGFFSVVMYYRGAADAHFVPLCPVVVTPRHYVTELVGGALATAHARRAARRKALGAASLKVHRWTRTAVFGAALTGALGAFASVPLVGRILFPRWAAWFRDRLGAVVTAPATTDLALERPADTAPGADPAHQGFDLAEMVAVGERLLTDIGLRAGFAPVVLVVGHGSASLNNPHNSAYNCGACGGGAGGPNGRVLARILNDPRVRAGLRPKGIDIPDSTWFVGGLHNTCNDTVTLSDVDRVPIRVRAFFDQANAVLAEACERNAHERSRRFMSAPLTLTPKAAKRHVEGRSEDLAQTRPELGHATNAVVFAGRRSRVRGLFLDRRCFLASYDPTADTPDSAVLTRQLQAIVPVCGGINLEYYFSHVDSAGFGAGTKLPHNITGLIGVMDGAASDLRTGLPWQMVEIHEPVRLLIVLETTPAKAEAIFAAQPGIARPVRNGWVQVATLDPDSAAIHVYQNGHFEPYTPEAAELPRRPSSAAWYGGQRGHLGFAAVG